MLGEAGIERLKVVRHAYRSLRQISANRSRFAIPIDALHEALVRKNVGSENALLVHSSVKDLYVMDTPGDATTTLHPLAYAKKVVEMLLDTVGPEGTILMPTDSGSGYDNAAAHQIFDQKKAPSNNGAITEIFRRRADVLRSTYPFQNVSGWGKRAKEWITAHENAPTAYPMGKGSPWCSLMEAGGKGVFLGNDFETNSSIHLVEYLHPEEYPIPIFFNRPMPMKYRKRDETVGEVDVWIHPVFRKSGATNRFCGYLNEVYGIYDIQNVSGAKVTLFSIQDQYQATYDEMKKGIGLYHSKFW